MKRRFLVFLIILIDFSAFGLYAQLTHSNKGKSISKGEYDAGSMENGYLLPFSGKNFKCYSLLSYYILDREYVNSRVYYTVIETYKELDKYYDRDFIYMEAAREKGGRLYPHRTHQNGLSIDFMTPLVKEGKPKYYNALGVLRYALNFDDKGKLKQDEDVQIDFNVMAHQILILDKNARKNGLKIRKVILNIDLKDELYDTEYGKKLKASGIYFARNLTPQLNKLHDDHFHVDFE